MKKEDYEWVFVKKWGKTYVAPKGIEKWIFNFSSEPKKYWWYNDKLGVYICNVSAL